MENLIEIILNKNILIASILLILFLILFKINRNNNLILNLAQRMNGTAHLEEHSLSLLIKGVIGRIIQWFALTRLPVTSKVRAWLQRRRGVNIGDNVFIGGNCFWIL